MFTNFTRVIANKVIHKNCAGIILHGRFLRQNPLETSEAEETISSILMNSYRNQRISEPLEYCSDLIDKVKQNTRFGGLLKEHNKNLPVHFRDQIISMIKFYQISAESLPIESVANLLYMISKFETRNDQLESLLINRLKEKRIEDFTVSNLGDLIFYFNSSPNIAQTHKDYVNVVIERAKYMTETGLMTVKLNGSNVGLYEANTDGTQSTLEKGVNEFISKKGSNDFTLFLQYKFVLPASNLLLSLISKKLKRVPWHQELSDSNELSRLHAYLQSFKQI